MQIRSRIRDVDVEHIVEDVEDHRLREELRSCQHFWVDSDVETVRHKVFNYAIENLNADEKLDHFINNLDREAKVNLAFGIILKKIEDRGFRYFTAQENKNLLDPSKLVYTRDDLAKLKDIPNKTEVIESCSRERLRTKWRFYKLKNSTFFSALLTDIPMAYKDAVFPEPPLKNCIINCLTFEQNTRQKHIGNLCFFRALALHLHGSQRLEEETSKLFISFISIMDGLSNDQFEGVHLNDIVLLKIC